MNPPQLNEYAPFFAGYINSIDENVFDTLHDQANDFPALLKSLPTEKEDYAYAAGKWTIKELAGHLIDTERIMVYRLTRIARNDKTPLPGFEENDYVKNAHFADRTLKSLANEFELLRRSNMFFLESLNDEELSRMGTTNGNHMSAKALLFIIAGHLKHHVNILHERYL